MKRHDFIKLSGMSIASLALSGCVPSQANTNTGAAAPPPAAAPAPNIPELAYRVQDANAPAVYFLPQVSQDALVKAYTATGRQLTGKVGLKLSFETPDGPYLNPQLLQKLRDQLDGTFMDCNGFSAPRNTTAGHLRLARDHGFTAVGPVDILDADGDLDLPVHGGKYLKVHRTGAHFANYDSMLSLVRFKAHHIRDYGGTIKNLTICLASTSGKALIHSAGREEYGYSPSDMESFLESMADAAKAALDAKPDRWIFINVLCGFAPSDSCRDAKPLPDIGVLASLDPVALDQAAVDFTFGAAPSPAVREVWERDHNVRVLQYAEERGVGRRHYRLLPVD